MSSIGDVMREEQREATRRMSGEDRLARALALGRMAVEAYAAQAGVTPREAARRIDLRDQLSRTPSACARALSE